MRALLFTLDDFMEVQILQTSPIYDQVDNFLGLQDSDKYFGIIGNPTHQYYLYFQGAPLPDSSQFNARAFAFFGALPEFDHFPFLGNILLTKVVRSDDDSEQLCDVEQCREEVLAGWGILPNPEQSRDA